MSVDSFIQLLNEEGNDKNCRDGLSKPIPCNSIAQAENGNRRYR